MKIKYKELFLNVILLTEYYWTEYHYNIGCLIVSTTLSIIANSDTYFLATIGHPVSVVSDRCA